VLSGAVVATLVTVATACSVPLGGTAPTATESSAPSPGGEGVGTGPSTPDEGDTLPRVDDDPDGVFDAAPPPGEGGDAGSGSTPADASDASGDAGGVRADAGRSAPGVRCGQGRCSGSFPSCCQTAQGALYCGRTCAAAVTRLDCDDSTDCATAGDVCCFANNRAACTAAANCTGVVLCDPDLSGASCPAGTSCGERQGLPSRGECR
jgi:hypothetical protein